MRGSQLCSYTPGAMNVGNIDCHLDNHHDMTRKITISANINKRLTCTFLSFFYTCLKMNLLRTASGLDGELGTDDTLDDHSRDSEEHTHGRSIPFDLLVSGDGGP